MSPGTTTEPVRVLRSTPGRLRIHLPGWDGEDPDALERSSSGIPGVNSVSARPATRNVLICFDPTIDAGAVLDAVASGQVAATSTAVEAAAAAAGSGAAAGSAGAAAAPTGGGPVGGDAQAARPPAIRVTGVLRERAGRFVRARIAVRGIDRDPEVARRVVEALRRRPDVRRAAASVATGRVLIEFSGTVTSIQDLLAELSSLELPDSPGEDRPAHPLDPAPIFQSGARLAGSLLGLGLLAARNVLGASAPSQSRRVPATVAGALGIVEGAPPMRDGLRHALGRDRAQLVLGGAAIVSLTFSGSPLGLLVNAAGALRLFTEARLRREAFMEYERRLEDAAEAQPGAVVRLDAGARVPLKARVIEGVGTVIGEDGLPDGITPGAEIQAGARVLRGPLVVEQLGDQAWTPQPRPAEPRPDSLARYLTFIGPASMTYAVLHAVHRRSLSAAFTGLLLVNPRPAVIGAEAADTSASARALRAGVTVLGTRPDRQVRRPDLLVLDGARVLTNGLEHTRIIPVGDADRGELAEIVSAMVSAAGSPWGQGSHPSHTRQASDAEFDGIGVSATVGGRRLRLEPPASPDTDAPEVRRGMEAGEQMLLLREMHDSTARPGEAGERARAKGKSGDPIAFVQLRPRLAPGVDELRRRCLQHGVEIAVLERGDRRASRMLARRAQMPLIVEADLLELVRDRQHSGERVAVLSDTPAAAEAFEACDLAIGLSSGRSSHFQARADLLAPGLPAVASVIEAGARRDQAADISVGTSIAANLAGGVWGLQGEPGVLRASHATYISALAAIAAGWERLRGGGRSRSVISRLTDPRPERWGRIEAGEVLAAMNSSPLGLRSAEARGRREARVAGSRRNAFVAAMATQLQSPLVGVLAAGGGLSLAMGATADVAIIGAVIVAGAAVGAWQERQAGRAAQALEQMGAARARVIRDGAVQELPVEEVVRGDLVLVGAGDRVVADARLLEAEALEVDEAALTGESLPVIKAPDAERAEARVLLEGSDVTVGSGKGVVVAVGAGTRLGATAAALAVEETRQSPLGQRLNRLFRQAMPVIIGGGALVTGAGIAWGGAPLAQLAVGASVAVAAVPEGLPLLAGVAEAAVARRLAARSALVRRLSAVEALGRVDVVCCDKTGTLTRGKLAVTMVESLRGAGSSPGELSEAARGVLLAAALASPSPDSPDALAHPTDAATLSAASQEGIEDQLRVRRLAEAPFDPVRSLHATAVPDRVCVKGAAEVVAPRCTKAAGPDGSLSQLDDAGRAVLLTRAEALASRGLRVLMVAEGSPETAVDDPRELTALGFVGISDPVRPGVAAAVNRCRVAGVRVVMLTGDHPATARAIADEIGLPLGEGAVLTGDQIGELDNGAQGERLAQASVLARITPIDKLRIVEALQRAGHTVAMTGDGVNDAPALRLADVGVAMGAGGTEVARQAADLILADDRFDTLTEALLEGRSLWENLHSALGLLLGGNLGEMILMAGAAVVGRGAVLGTRQILAVNLVTDVLPAVAIAVQPPRQSDLERVTKERDGSFDRRLVRDILRRGTATAVPALGAVLAASAIGASATTVGFASIIVTQLAQTLQAGYSQNQLSPSVIAAIGGSGGLVAGTLALPPLRRFLGLAPPTPVSVALILASAPAATLLAGALSPRHGRSRARLIEAGPGPRALFGPRSAA